MPTPQRLPIVNSDDGVWGDIIRQYIMKEHFNDDTDNAANGGHQFITVRAGTTSKAPLTLTSGSLLTTPAIGSIEFNGDSLYFTQTTGTTRKKIATYDDASGATGDIYYRNSTGFFTRLGIGGANTVLKSSGGLPAWSGLQLSDLSDSSSIVTTTGTQTLTNKTITLPQLSSIATGTLTNTSFQIAGGSAGQYPAYSSIPKYLWHDNLRFNRWTGVPTYETYNGSWSAQTLNKSPFAGKEGQGVTLANGTTVTAVRWTWNSANWQYSYAQWWSIGFPYIGATTPTNNILIESSADGIAWTTRHTSSVSANGVPVWLFSTDNGSDAYLRLTITNTNSQSIAVTSIKALSARWGNQGGGSEYEHPYDWDSDRKITIGTTAGARSDGVLNIGTTSSTTAADGMYFGNDTNLYRSAANTLQTDSTLIIAAPSGKTGLTINRASGKSSISAGSADGHLILDSSGQSLRLNNYVTDNISIAAGGGRVGIGTSTISNTGKIELVASTLATEGIAFGSDTNLYRSAANTLKTDDNLIIGTAGTSAGSAVTIDGNQTLTSKTISGSSNTLSNIPIGAISATGTPSGTTYLRGDGTWSALGSTNWGTIGGTLSSQTDLQAALDDKAGLYNNTYPLLSKVALDFDSFTHNSTIMVPMLNDLAFNNIRGGSTSATLNGSPGGLTNVDNAFKPDTSVASNSSLVSTDVLVITVTCHKSIRYEQDIGILMSQSWRAQDVTIEVFYSGAWTQIYTVTGSTDKLHSVHYHTNAVNDITQIRYTLTNFNSSLLRIISLFSTDYDSDLLSAAYLTIGGGTMYGQISNSTDPSADDHLARRGYVNNGTATLTNKTLGTGTVISVLPTGSGVSSASTASTLAARDANKNLFADNFIATYTTTATAAGTTTLTVASTQIQVFTGTSTQIVKLPTTSIVAGTQYRLINNSTGAVTVQSSAGNQITILAANTSGLFTALQAAPTANTHWDGQYWGTAVGSGKTLTVSQSLTLAGTDGTTMTFPSTSGNVVTEAATQTLTNKTLTAPVLSGTITGTYTFGGTPTFPSSIVTTTGTQTLTNKTLTTPRIDQILDTNGSVMLNLPAQASAVNYLTIKNRQAGSPISLEATGSDADIWINISPKGNAGVTVWQGTSGQPVKYQADGVDADVNFNIVPKGTGRLQAGGVNVPTISSTDTLTNKTLASPTFSGSYSFGGTPTWPTFNQNTTGSAATLTTTRTLTTNLASTTAANFNGSANASIGVTGSLPVTNGGTGRATSTTAYGLIAAGTTATGAQQTIAPGTAGQFLKSAGASALAAFASITATDISDSTSVGRSVLTATDAAAARTAIGAGTGNGDGDVTLNGVQTLTNKDLTGSGNTFNASNLTTGTVPDARLTGTYTGFTHRIDGANTVFTTPNTGSTNNLGRTVYGLAEYRSNSATQVGAIIFYAPNTTSSIMHQLEISGLLYNQNIVQLTVQGYRTTGAWNDARKISTGTVDVQVRWGVDPSGKNCLILGDVGTSWSYPHLSIVRAMFSHTGASDAYSTGWSVGVVTDLTGFTQITSDITDSAMVGSISGNAATATTLQTARTIGGVSFNGSANINLPGVNTTGNQSTTGSAATLTTARTIQTNLASTASQSFNGSANITPGVTGTLPVGNGGTGATTLTGLVKGNGTGAMTAATAGTDYVTPTGSETLSGKTLTSPVINGTVSGTGVASAPTVSTLVLRDANGNVSANAFVHGFTTTATAAGTTTLTITSDSIQEFTGTSTQTVRLPTTSIVAGARYTVINSSTGAVTVQSSGANTVSTLPGGTSATFTALVATPTTAANWESTYAAAGGDASTNTATSVDGEVALFSGTGGKTLKRATGSGIAKLTSGVLSTATAGTDYVTPTGSETLSSKTLTSPVINGTVSGTGISTATTANTLALRDANGNLSANALLPGFTTTATAAGTTTLTIASDQVQVFTGSSTQTVRLPTTGVVAGGQYRVINNSTGAVTVQSSAGNQITILAANTSGLFMALQATPTLNTHWDGQYWGTNIAAGKTLASSNSLTLAGTDGTTMTFPSTSGNVVTEGATQTLSAKTLASPTFSGSYSFGGTPTWPTFNQNTTGSAATLTTARTFQTNLASTASASFNGSANVTPGVTGTLGVANGGTGRATATTAYGIIAAGTTATGVQQTISPGTAGQFLKSAGASALASFVSITAADISDSTTVGRSVLTAIDAAAARTAIGAGTGSGDVTLNGVQTLTNKTFNDSSFTLQDEADNTKKIIFSLGGLSPSTTVTLNAPNVSTGSHTIVTRNSTDILKNKTLNDPQVNNYTEGVVAIGTVTTASTLDLTNGTLLTATLTASTACTFTMPTATAGKSFVLMLKQAAATGNGSATFTGVKWNASGVPTITAAAGKMDILSFFSDGTNWYGSYTQGYTP